MYSKWIVVILLIISSVRCSDLIGIIPEGDARLSISFKNNSNYKLEKLIVAEKSIGSLESGTQTSYRKFETFRFDTGLPDEDASAFVNERLLTNYHRGYWCSTEKITVDSGKYLIEIEVVDTVLFLSCKNAPTIFDP